MYRLTKSAAKDIHSVWDFVAEDSAEAADKIVSALDRAMTRLASSPKMGHWRKELTDHGYRFWPVYSYLIVYRDDVSPLEIIRILHTSRDVRAILKDMPYERR